MSKFIVTALAAICALSAYAGTPALKATKYAIPSTVAPGQEFTIPFTVKNSNNAPVASITVEVKVGEQAIQTDECAVEIAASGTAECTATATCDAEGADIPVYFRITKVDGEANKNANTKYNGTLKCLTSGYPQNVVCEESTCVGCGYCVMGIVGLHEMAEYAPGRFIPIAVHNNDQKTDPMNVCGTGMCYQPFKSHVNGNPSSFLNRNFGQQVEPRFSELKAKYEELIQFPALCEITAEIVKTSDPMKVDLKTSSVFALTLPDADYGIAYSIVQDKCGPYTQFNPFSGEPELAERYECPEWADKDDPAPTLYNHTAREGGVYNPISHSLPIEITKGEAMEYTASVSLAAVIDKKGEPALMNYGIVAMVVNRRTGMIENAVLVHPDDFDGVQTVAASESFEASEWYTLQGVRLSQPPTSGLYIERAATGAARVRMR